MLRLAMKDSSFRMTRGKDGKNIGYSDNDRGGFGSGNANKFVPEFVEYRSPAGSAKNPYLHPSAPPKDPTIVAVPPGKQIGNQGCAFGQKFSVFPTDARPETKIL
jgi:hypothetical protein